LITDFYDCIASGRRFAIDGSEGAKVVKVILGAYESQGKKIEIK
jgi:predicted dehydrogenase